MRTTTIEGGDLRSMRPPRSCAWCTVARKTYVGGIENTWQWDTGSTDRLVIRVQELIDGDGTLRTLATWDSSTAVDFAGTRFEMEGNTDDRTGVVCPLRRGSTDLFGLDWRFRTYFVDASMSRTASTGKPGIMVVKVYPVN